MSRSDLVYLDDILQAIRDIEEFTSGMTHEQFLADRKLDLSRACERLRADVEGKDDWSKP